MSTAKAGASRSKKMVVLVLMMFALCTIYVLPYLRYQYFTPLLEACGLVGQEQKFGNLMSVYGIMNVLFYLPGGIIADKFDPKKLLVFSMVSSGVLGLWMATWPGYEMLLVIHVLWGFTTVLTFWSSSIKVVNMLAASDEQGEMFGMLEGGRGVLGLVLNAGWVAAFAYFSTQGKDSLGMTTIVASCSILMILSGVFLGILLPKSDATTAVNSSLKDSFKSLLGAFKLPITWVLAAMIFVSSATLAAGAYYAPFLEGACLMPVVFTATFAIVRGEGARIVASVGAAGISKKMGRSSMALFVSCVAMIVFGALMLIVPATAATLWPIMIILTLISVFAVANRALYWAIIEEAGTQKFMVGSVIGVASLFGYLPDTFIHTLFGGWLQNDEFMVAYNKIFMFCVVTVIVGAVFAFWGEKIITKHQASKKAEIAE